MKKIMLIALILGAVLIVAGIVGVTMNRIQARNFDENLEEDYYNYRNDIDADDESYYHRGSMMGGYYGYYSADGDQEKIDIQELEELVNDYINDYDEELAISDIFVFEDSDYYFSIIEEDTEMGAMELLVNPYTGYVYHENGPNMMWNYKYGSHSSVRSDSIRGGRGSMMGGKSSRYYQYEDYDFEGNTVTKNEAIDAASDYVKSYIDEDLAISDKGHEFYGYYTFHIEDGNETYGMISVNGLTGDVWYHNWHGDLVEVIEMHSH